MISIRETWRCLTTLVSHQISAGERRDFKDGRRCVQIFVSGCCVCLCVDGLRDRRSIFIIRATKFHIINIYEANAPPNQLTTFCSQ